MALVLNGTTGISTDTGTGVRIQRPAFWVWNNGSSSASSGTIVWNTVITNIGNCYSVASGRFTAPVAGTYLFSACPGRYNPGNNDIYQYFRKNGANIGERFDPANNSGSTAQYWFFVYNMTIQLNANDYVDYSFNGGGAGSAQGISGAGSFFCGHLIG